MRSITVRLLALAASALCLLAPTAARAVGESQDGFPNWNERVIHQWMNRARADPAVEMQKCGTNCPEAACYKPIAPLSWSLPLGRAARYHSAEMAKQGFFAHDSACTLVQNISALYPAMCDGSASCACVGGVKACSGACTTWSQRVQLFGGSPSGEIIAGGSDPNSAFYLWLFEPFNKTVCAFDYGPPTNGHRWNILKAGPAVGTGVVSASVGNFGGGPAVTKVPSAAHYPRQSTTVEVWANWYDNAAPQQALVNIGGTCQPMTRMRGTDTNGAWMASVTGVGTGCHRYFVLFKDAGGNVITYPTTGSLGIGPAGSCADWDTSRPMLGSGCGNIPVPDAGASDLAAPPADMTAPKGDLAVKPGDLSMPPKADLSMPPKSDMSVSNLDMAGVKPDGGGGGDGGGGVTMGGCSVSRGRAASPIALAALALLLLLYRINCRKTRSSQRSNL